MDTTTIIALVGIALVAIGIVRIQQTMENKPCVIAVRIYELNEQRNEDWLWYFSYPRPNRCYVDISGFWRFSI